MLRLRVLARRSVTPDGERHERLAQALAGRYRIVGDLGWGSWRPYLADDLAHDRQVELRVTDALLAPASEVEFLRQLARVAQLDHPHIMSVLDCGRAGAFLFFVLPRIPGESLRERLLREEQLAFAEAIRIAGQVAAALDHAHSQGVLHRNVAPGSIRLSAGNAYLTDFEWTARVAVGDAVRPGSGIVAGTPAYMSPELCRGSPIDGRSDTYALACVVHEMMAGTPPFTATDPAELMRQHLAKAPPSLRAARSEVTAAVAACVLKALSKDPANRHDTASEFAQLLHG